jgi:hypothetical protein
MVRVAAVVDDLMLYSRIESAARVTGAALLRVDDPSSLPADAELVLVDWSARRDSWTDALRAHPGRVVLFGPHTDLEAHAAARAAGLGPMWARSRLLTSLGELLVRPRT